MKGIHFPSADREHQDIRAKRLCFGAGIGDAESDSFSARCRGPSRPGHISSGDSRRSRLHGPDLFDWISASVIPARTWPHVTEMLRSSASRTSCTAAIGHIEFGNRPEHPMNVVIAFMFPTGIVQNSALSILHGSQALPLGGSNLSSGVVRSRGRAVYKPPPVLIFRSAVLLFGWSVPSSPTCATASSSWLGKPVRLLKSGGCSSG